MKKLSSVIILSLLIFSAGVFAQENNSQNVTAQTQQTEATKQTIQEAPPISEKKPEPKLVKNAPKKEIAPTAKISPKPKIIKQAKQEVDISLKEEKEKKEEKLAEEKIILPELAAEEVEIPKILNDQLLAAPTPESIAKAIISIAMIIVGIIFIALVILQNKKIPKGYEFRAKTYHSAKNNGKRFKFKNKN